MFHITVTMERSKILPSFTRPKAPTVIALLESSPIASAARISLSGPGTSHSRLSVNWQRSSFPRMQEVWIQCLLHRGESNLQFSVLRMETAFGTFYNIYLQYIFIRVSFGKSRDIYMCLGSYSLFSPKVKVWRNQADANSSFIFSFHPKILKAFYKICRVE